MELLIYADMVSAVAKAFQEFCGLRLAVIISPIKPFETVRAGKMVVSYNLHEAMKRILLAYRAGDPINFQLQWIDWHTASLKIDTLNIDTDVGDGPLKQLVRFKINNFASPDPANLGTGGA